MPGLTRTLHFVLLIPGLRLRNWKSAAIIAKTHCLACIHLMVTSTKFLNSNPALWGLITVFRKELVGTKPERVLAVAAAARRPLLSFMLHQRASGTKGAL